MSPVPILPATPVHSSNLKSVGYDAQTQHLQVNFKSGETYDYFNVPPPAHQVLMFAKSKGKFLDDAIRPRFRHVRHPRPGFI